MSLLAGLFAVVAMQTQSPAAQAAADFAQACLNTRGDRAAATTLAETRQWELSEPGAPVENTDWIDRYRTAHGMVAIYQTPARTLSGSVGATISGPALIHCLVMLPAAAGQWRDAAAVLDASDKVEAFPAELQPGEGGSRGVVRFYVLSDQKPDGSTAGVVTVNEEATSGLMTIKMMRPILAATDQH